MVVRPESIHPKSKLEFIHLKPASAFRCLAIDRVDNKYWLVHDCGLWVEGEIVEDVVKFLAPVLT